MEEKNVTKISLSTFFLILAIIAIIVMGLFIYKLNNDKTTEIQKSTELQSQVNSLSTTVNDLQGKMNKVSETINSNNSVENSTTNNTSTSFTDEQVKTALTNYLELYGDSKCAGVLNNLDSKGLLPSFDSTGLFDYTWTKTTLKYSDYKKAMLNFVSEKEYERYWKTGIETIKETEDGYLAYGQGGGDRPNYEVKSLTNTSGNNYTGTINWWYDFNTDDSDRKGSITHSFTITSYNGKCVIDSIDINNNNNV